MVEQLINSLKEEDYQLSDSSFGNSLDEISRIDYAHYEKQDYIARKKEYDDFIKNRHIE